jgi:transglutaminase-like putative cysteine protease
MVYRILAFSTALWLSPLTSPLYAEQSGFSPDTPCQATKSRAATYEVDFRVAITAPAKTRQLRVWLPLATSDDCQSISGRSIETFPRSVEPSIQAESVFGNTFAYFEFNSPDGAQLITHRFTARIKQLDWNVDYRDVQRPQRWPESFAAFQRPDPRANGSNELHDVLDEIKKSTRGQSDTDRLVNAMQWVDQNLTYDHVNASLSADPTHALINRRGHCSDYHGLCSTLAREVGYPSRVLYGLQMFDKGSPSHCKLEVYLPKYGWVSFDLSETQKLAIKVAEDASLSARQREASIEAIKQRTMHGFRENTWLVVTRGVNYQLAPSASRPVSIIRTIYAEADGIPLPEPDPSNVDQRTFSSMTIQRVDEIGDASKRFDEL